jgi:hypothetical protein
MSLLREIQAAAVSEDAPIASLLMPERRSPEAARLGTDRESRGVPDDSQGELVDAIRADDESSEQRPGPNTREWLDRLQR